MSQVNYIKHLNAVFQKFAEDSQLIPTHISLYMALFQIWNYNRFVKEFMINREEVMQLAKIGSTSTYHKGIKLLHQKRYLSYKPSKNRFVGSKIIMFNFQTTDRKHTFENQTSDKLQSGYSNKQYKTSTNKKTINGQDDFLNVSKNKNYNEPL